MIQRVVERAPTPEPDVVERVIVRPQPQQLIERIIEHKNLKSEIQILKNQLKEKFKIDSFISHSALCK